MWIASDGVRGGREGQWERRRLKRWQLRYRGVCRRRLRPRREGCRARRRDEPAALGEDAAAAGSKREGRALERWKEGSEGEEAAEYAHDEGEERHAQGTREGGDGGEGGDSGLGTRWWWAVDRCASDSGDGAGGSGGGDGGGTWAVDEL